MEENGTLVRGDIHVIGVCQSKKKHVNQIADLREERQRGIFVPTCTGDEIENNNWILFRPNHSKGFIYSFAEFG